MKLVRVFGYGGIVLGLIRFTEYYFFGDIHHGYALAWAFHALLSGLAILYLVRKKPE